MESEVKKRTRGKNKAIFYGYGHCLPEFLCPLWRRIFCNRGWHLWNEQFARFRADQRMCCEACGESVKIR